MGKLSDDDFREMSGRLRARAARLMRQLDAGAGYRDQIERDLAKRLGRRAAASRREPATRRSQRDVLRERASTRERRRRAILQDVRAASCQSRQVSTCRAGGRGKGPAERALLVASFVPLCARAVSRAVGTAQFEMPDPKQMSGIPRPVDRPAERRGLGAADSRRSCRTTSPITRSSCTSAARCRRSRPTRTAARSSTSCRPARR